jgi:hypothetical protein
MPIRRPAPLTWSRQERATLRRLSTPRRIQDLLDQFAYRTEDAPAAPRRALAERRAHCFDGALLAAAVLRFHGHPPLLLDLRAIHDDDHVLAVFRQHGGWGAVAKSNFVGLRYREPIHRTLRELALSYFEPYYNLKKRRTLRAFSARPLDLRRFDRLGWEYDDTAAPTVAARLDDTPHRSLLTSAQEGRLTPLDLRSYRAGMLGTDIVGVRRG